MLVSKAPDPDTQLTWFNRKGPEPTRWAHRRVHGSGTVPRWHPCDRGQAQLAHHSNHRSWELDVSGNEPPRKRTLGADLEHLPVWVDNDHVVYAVGGGGEKLYEMSASGADNTRPLPAMNHTYPTSVSRDRRSVLVTKPSRTRQATTSGCPPLPGIALEATHSSLTNAIRKAASSHLTATGWPTFRTRTVRATSSLLR